MVDECGQWRWDLFESLLLYEILLHIVTVKVPLHATMRDIPRWVLTENGQFRVSSAYDVRIGVQFGPVEPIWRAIVVFKRISRVKTFIWLTCLGEIVNE
ncbi:hypothetical protein V6N12_037537 [Hibiscus sabdariffa]